MSHRTQRIKAVLLAAGAGLMAVSGVVATEVAAQTSREMRVNRPMADAAYWNASLPVEQRVADLLARMTLEEKIAQIITVWDSKASIQNDDNTFSPDKAAQVFPNGIGQIARPSDTKGPISPRVERRRDIDASVDYVIAAQRWAMENTRLGIPILFHEESLHGFAARDATAFPQSIGLASTWDPDLVREVNALIASEVRARGVHRPTLPPA